MDMLTRLSISSCRKVAIATVLTAIVGTAILGMASALRDAVEVETTIQSDVGSAIFLAVLRAL
jgi:uncharacterized membrane protein YeaQ/YmgE (transglycosylase-associated protein family)